MREIVWRRDCFRASLGCGGGGGDGIFMVVVVVGDNVSALGALWIERNPFPIHNSGSEK